MKTFSSVQELNAAAAAEPVQGAVRVQVSQILNKTTKNGKPYLEAAFSDVEGTLTFKVWDNAPWHPAVVVLKPQSAVEIAGNWQQSQYGMEASELEIRPLTAEEEELLLAGSPELAARQQEAWQEIQRLTGTLQDPRLRELCLLFLDTFAVRFRRSGAARKMHHARRGGLAEHTAGVMRAADALCSVYPTLNRDLVLTGALFHDCGKMWENTYEEHSFVMPYNLTGELMGHITMGIEIVNRLWAQLVAARKEEWKTLTPSTEHVRFHLLHLIASHHGSLEYGSPVIPKTPEALALHHADDMDAKMEMFRSSYESAVMLSDHVVQAKFPLPNVVKPLPSFEPLA